MQNRFLYFPVLPLLITAAFWNPPMDDTRYDSARWIESGLAHERRGDFATAEHDLLEAARIDRLFQPRWTLAGFYFRRDDSEKFLHAIADALAVGHRDLGALFDLCWQLPSGCPNLEAQVMPASKSARTEYLFYLMNTNRWPPASNMAKGIAERADASELPLLLNYCDLALAHGEKLPAWAVWSRLANRGLLPFPPGNIISNGDFRAQPSGHCFDWRMAAGEVAAPFRPGQAVFTLSGFQKDQEMLLEQPLALDPSLRYRLHFEYKTEGLSPNAGVRWIAGTAQSAGFAASEWTPGQFDFAGTAESLLLTYQRPSGSTVAQGTLWLRKVDAAVR